MKIVIILTSILTLSISCQDKKSVNFEHFDKEQIISCITDLDPLLNEALYVFEEDLKSLNSETEQNIKLGYSKFMYRAFEGSMSYGDMISKQALHVGHALLANEILINNGGKSNLNYSHPLVECILIKMKDRELSNTLRSLIETSSMDPKLFSSRLIDFGKVAHDQRYLALYIALDGYYQKLITPLVN